jgi:hypothetical protein
MNGATKVDEGKSALAAAIEARGRRAYVFDVTGFFGPGAREMPRIGFRVAVKAEEDNAIVLAHGYAHQRSLAAGDAAESARKDADLLGDAKLIHALCEVCRDVKPVGGEIAPSANDAAWGISKYSAFPGPEWMRKNLTTDHLAALMNLYTEVRRAESPVPEDVTEERVEALGELCRNHAADSIPEAVLAAYPREWLTHAFVMQSIMLGAAKQSVDVLLKEQEAREAVATAEEASDEPPVEPAGDQ